MKIIIQIYKNKTKLLHLRIQHKVLKFMLGVIHGETVLFPNQLVTGVYELFSIHISIKLLELVFNSVHFFS